MKTRRTRFQYNSRKLESLNLFGVGQQERESDCANQMSIHKHILAGSSSCFCKAVQACEKPQKDRTQIDAYVVYLFYSSL